MEVKISYTRLLVADLQACFEFYRDVMEFKVVMEALADGYAEFTTPDMRLSLFRRQEMAEMISNDRQPLTVECQDRVALIFTIPDLDSAYQELKAKGAQFVTEPLNNPYYSLKTVYLRDPDGTLIGLFQPVV
ncbi:VOC family protein [Aliterella atlantica]|uniref:Glyoxalase/bleomycin resistance protein/dioxygenase n=1 Tax=Aliterella atlantica CENA595 TaxID=1618023 RepID=A0A0D8ZSM3_9CYAN|nr:VOC family protein [Aliterella atlantica]KJH71735.1 glyoxalase/bleomycin resistance protein/dioxygenase [Aliterella atlantica CENA595]